MTMTDKESVAQLLKETIIQLCKANVFYSGQVEIDGIICISGQIEGQELVIKVHEIFATPQDLRNPYAAIRYQPIAAKFSDLPNFYGDYQRRELKRKRLENSFDCLRPSFAYSYLSKLVYGRNHPSVFTEPDLDQRNSATDLSIKSSLAGSNHCLDPRNENSPSPHQSVETKYDLHDETISTSSQTPVQSLLGKKAVLPSESWSPSKSLSSLPQCRLCLCCFESSEALSDHNETVHSLFTCLCCFKTFTSRSNLERHSRLHTGHRPYSCDVCGKSFSRKDHLSNHATKHAFKCSTCSQRCPDKGALISHYLYDHSTTLTNICSFCNKGFCSSELYEEHKKSHPQLNACEPKSNSESTGSQVMVRSLSLERYSCMNCAFETNDKVSLAKHQLLHSNAQQLYTCMGCGKIYEDPLQYSDHMILHQKERDIFECCICHQVCSTMSSLRRHEAAHVPDDNSDMETVAEEDRFHCGECNCTFETHAILQEHLDVHALAKGQHSCRTCQRAFENRADLESHVDEMEGQCGVNLEDKDSGNCVENCLEVADNASRRDKRKQKQPKLVVNRSGEMSGAGDSDIEVVESKSSSVRDDYKNCDFVITDNPACVIQVSAESDVGIKMEPVKSILNRASTAAKPRNYLVKLEDQDLSSLLSMKTERFEDAIEKNVEISNLDSPVRLTPKHRIRGKGRRRDASTDKCGRMLAMSESNVSPNGSPDDDTTLNNNSMSARNENRPLSTDIPLGPFVCAVCNFETETFQLLDNHCATLHSRSPCMFCSKTFAQKANRDRHHCLHTGDKPYSCPECDEKFSRGDKLKMHRVRAHGVQYPLYGSRNKDPSSRDRDFSASPSSFLADGFASVPSLYVANLPGLSVFESHDPDDVTNLRTSNILPKSDADEVGSRVSEFPKISSNLMKKWVIEKKTSAHWEKMDTNETEIDTENKVLDSVSAGN